jgi:hypothetical protein
MNIKNLKVEKWEEEGKFFERWSWSLDQDYRTNDLGEGIFKYISGIGWQQVAGTLDFSLRGLTLSGARQKLNRRFDEE